LILNNAKVKSIVNAISKKHKYIVTDNS